MAIEYWATMRVCVHTHTQCSAHTGRSTYTSFGGKLNVELSRKGFPEVKKPEDKELAQQRRGVVKAVRGGGKWFTVFDQVQRHIDKGKRVMWEQNSNRGAGSWVGLNPS